MKISKCGKVDIKILAELERLYIECPWSEQMLEDGMESGTTFFKAEIDDEIAGYGGIQYVLDEGNICNIAVFEKHRNKGVGSSILSTMIDEAKKLNVATLFLEVNEKNAPAINLYKKFGFEQIAVRKNYYKSGNAIIMSLKLQ